MTNILVTPPAVESLLALSSQYSFWPRQIRQNKQIQKQAELRRNLLLKIGMFFGQTPLSITDLTQTYNLLADFLEADPLHRRIILYLPFELLPHKSQKHERFTKIYMQRWEELLSVCDVRANFVNGDVLEPELRTEPLKRVVKVAHLIPELLKRDLISNSTVLQLIADNPDSVLEESILDIMPMGILHIDDTFLSTEKVSAERLHWLEREIERKKIEKAAEDIAISILNESMSAQAFLEQSTDDIATLSRIRSLIKARGKYFEFEKVIRILWERNEPKIQDAIISLWSYLCHLNVLDKSYLKQFGVKLPILEGSFSEASEAIQQEAERIKAILEFPFLYRAFIIFGSRLKGYATKESDFDIAVFVKYDLSDEERMKLQKALGSNKIVEFSLENRDEEFVITNLPSWTHVLFGGAWCGEKSFIKKIYGKLLVKYLNDNKERRIWLEEMERDAIQYRLMHHGYSRFFPQESERETFYDSGFRKLATIIFLTRVFLPIRK